MIPKASTVGNCNGGKPRASGDDPDPAIGQVEVDR